MSGMSEMVWFNTTKPTADVSDWTRAASAMTVTFSVMAPTSSLISTRAGVPVSITIPLWLNCLNPVNSAESVYLPGFISRNA